MLAVRSVKCITYVCRQADVLGVDRKPGDKSGFTERQRTSYTPEWVRCGLQRHHSVQQLSLYMRFVQTVCIFTARLARYILAVVILPVRHTPALWQNHTMHCENFNTIRKGSHSSFLTTTVIGGRRPVLSKICAQSDPSTPFENADFDRFPLITSQR